MKNTFKTILLFLTIIVSMGAEGTIDKKLKNYGTVVFYYEDAGLGYIENKTDIYFCYDSDLIDEIEKGDKVSFYVYDSRKGVGAKNVRIVKKKRK